MSHLPQRLGIGLLAGLLAGPVPAQGIETAPLQAPTRAERQDGQGGFFTSREESEPVTDFKKAPVTTNLPDLPERIRLSPADTRSGAVLRALDKMTGATRQVEIGSGRTVRLDRLTIEMEACLAPEGGGSTGTRAFLRIRDMKSDGGRVVFSGWMFADSPALSALDHPRYDVWVINCTTSEGVASSASE